jgi:hypothetical protein
LVVARSFSCHRFDSSALATTGDAVLAVAADPIGGAADPNRGDNWRCVLPLAATSGRSAGRVVARAIQCAIAPNTSPKIEA